MWRPVAVSDLLGAIMRGTPTEKRLVEGRIWLVWDDAVGKTISSHAQPASFREGTLTLVVDSAPWMQQLNFLKRDLIAKVNEQVGQDLVTDIYMKAGRIHAVAPVETPKPKRRELSEAEQSWVREQAESVTDPELRAVFERLIRRDRENR